MRQLMNRVINQIIQPERTPTARQLFIAQYFNERDDNLVGGLFGGMRFTTFNENCGKEPLDWKDCPPESEEDRRIERERSLARWQNVIMALTIGGAVVWFMEYISLIK